MNKTVILLALALGLPACGGVDDAADSQAGHIVDGVEATDYPESVLVFGKAYPNGRWGTGTLLDPMTVLTHDSMGNLEDLEVFAPHAGGEPHDVADVEVHSWGPSDTWPEAWHELDWDTPVVHHVALLRLEKPIVLASESDYPVLASAPPADGTEVVRLGSNSNGDFENTTYVSEPDAVELGDAHNLPTDLVALRKTLYGDGGGGVFIEGSKPHQLVGVNWGYGDGETWTTHFWEGFTGSGPARIYDYLVRVDLVRDWIVETRAAWDAEGI